MLTEVRIRRASGDGKLLDALEKAARRAKLKPLDMLREVLGRALEGKAQNVKA